MHSFLSYKVGYKLQHACDSKLRVCAWKIFYPDVKFNDDTEQSNTHNHVYMDEPDTAKYME